MLPAYCRDAVEVVRPAWREERGTPVPDWSRSSSTLVTGCRVCPEAGSADLDGRTHTSQPWSLYAPPGTDAAVGDRVVWGARTFEVAAPPEERRDPCGGALDHVKVPLVERRG